MWDNRREGRLRYNFRVRNWMGHIFSECTDVNIINSQAGHNHWSLFYCWLWWSNTLSNLGFRKERYSILDIHPGVSIEEYNPDKTVQQSCQMPLKPHKLIYLGRPIFKWISSKIWNSTPIISLLILLAHSCCKGLVGKTHSYTN